MRIESAWPACRLLRVTLCLCIVAAPILPAAIAAGGLEVSGDGTTAWLLRADTSIERIDLATGDSTVLVEPAGIVAIAMPADARVLHAIAPSGDAKSTLLLALSPATGEEVSRRELKGHGKLLAVTTDGSFVCVVGRRSGGRSQDSGDWTLTVLDAVSGKVAGPLLLGIEPLAMTLRDEAGAGRAGARLMIATFDRVATWLIEPPASSWFYRSPGENRDIDSIDRSPLVALLRGDELVLIDPRRRQRDGGRVQLTGDDATSTIHLPGPGSAVALTPDGSTAVVLRPDGAGIELYDTLDDTPLGTSAVDDLPDLLARRMPVDADRSARITVASSLRGLASVIDRPLPPPRPEPEPERPERPAQEVAAPPPPMTAPLPPEPGPAPPAAPEPATPEPQATRTAPEPAAPEPGTRSEPGTPPPGPAPAPEPVPEPAPSRPSALASLTGRVSGAAGTTGEVLLFGPDNILRLSARAPIAADGTFSFPLPAPGKYRVLVSGESGAYLFTSPQYRMLEVTPEQVTEGEGIEGIDFFVRGSL